MARAGKLKVFRTPIGFHDAYVAAPSRKAALAAWGADSNLFASGAAELVEDPALTREPLARPGEVVKRLRGTLDEHVAALLPQRKRAAAPAPAAPSVMKRAPKPKPKPRPSRAALDRAEAALTTMDARHAAQDSELAQRQAELDRARRALEIKQGKERAGGAARVDTARVRYENAMQAWRDD